MTVFVCFSLCQTIVPCVSAQREKLVPNNSLSDPDCYGILYWDRNVRLAGTSRCWSLQCYVLATTGAKEEDRMEGDDETCVLLQIITRHWEKFPPLYSHIVDGETSFTKMALSIPYQPKMMTGKRSIISLSFAIDYYVVVSGIFQIAIEKSMRDLKMNKMQLPIAIDSMPSTSISFDMKSLGWTSCEFNLIKYNGFHPRLCCWRITVSKSNDH